MSKPDAISAPWEFGYPTWMDQALCAAIDPDAFFPDQGRADISAKKVCKSCPVNTACLTYAIEHDIRFGIWGGMGETDRARMRKTA